ncbi:hypothetical protein PTKIN_Ptkin14bG0163100 [Pterospermum kingtungense]
MAELKKEVAEYDDFILLDIEEYSKLPYKTLAFFKAAYALFDSEFYVKADDDIYLRPDRLSLCISKRTYSLSDLPWMHEKGLLKPRRFWTEGEESRREQRKAEMRGGSSRDKKADKSREERDESREKNRAADVVTSLVALRNDSFRMFSNEDVTIGSWMLAMNVNHEDNRELCAPECTPTSIAVWDIPKCSGLCNPERKLLELHQLDACSNSPTLPSDDD